MERCDPDCVIPTSSLIPIPADISFTDAAAIPEAFMTAYQALFWIGALQPNQKVLIHAGARFVHRRTRSFN
jgi:NADPH:quinone reductase-like Zn-dependent oxidoreductase